MFQDAALFPWRTVLGNVEFGLLGVPRRERRDRARQMLELVRLDGVARRHPRALSAACASASRSPAPRAGTGGAADGRAVRGARRAHPGQLKDELICVWTRNGQTIVFVTHAVDEALYLADEVVLLSARPATVRARVAVDLPRPRRREELIGSARTPSSARSPPSRRAGSVPDG